MFRARQLRVAGVGLVALASTLALTAGAGTAASASTGTLADPDPVGHTYPTNAAKIFQWGLSAWEDEFILPLSDSWLVSDESLVRNQNGMLTLEGTADSGRVTATVDTHARRYGRWEARVRSDVRDTGGTPYRVVWELVHGRYNTCGNGITLATYTVGDRAADMDIRSSKDAVFTDELALPLDDYEWHTYAVEITRDHISWFADTKVIMTERRPEALTGTRYRMRFRLEPVAGERMDFTRMQMDWARYYTLDRPGALPVDAPPATEADTVPTC